MPGDSAWTKLSPAQEGLIAEKIHQLEVQARGAFLLLMETGRLLGLEETKMATAEDQHMLRLLTPVAKLYTAKQSFYTVHSQVGEGCAHPTPGSGSLMDLIQGKCLLHSKVQETYAHQRCTLQVVAVVLEGLECFGGQGYMEDTRLAFALRDAQVLAIWEGTTNVLALDVLRSLVKSQGKVMEAFFSTAQTKMEVASSSSELEAPVATVQRALHKLKEFLQKISFKGEAGMQLAARDFAYTLARIYGEPARIGNPYLEDVFLQGYLESRLPPKVFAGVSMDLERFGARVKDEIDSLGRECELNPPRLQQFDAWGQRVDQIITCSAWKRMKVISAEEGLIAEAYERKYSSWSRVHQIAKLYLYAPSAGIFTCPLAMTDGAAKVLESLGIPEPVEEAYARLTSRDPRSFWTSGQWMTERKGGSDVANGTETVALKLPDGTYSLHGLKWFTSATDSDVTLTLARIMAADGRAEQGSKGLSLFYLEVRDKDGNLNGIEMQRLKDKMGTRQLPTAELLLDGARAYRISAEGRGVASIANMLTITRIHNVISAVGLMRRVIFLARDYATKREAFGKYLKEHPLHMQTLARMEVSILRGGPHLKGSRKSILFAHCS
ncbi:hypothetical protein lerEdw1_019457 [Lerista edwardsae]|nr:hypothetical protein lerEdw1_019457 [Lerista edwardsae]